GLALRQRRSLVRFTDAAALTDLQHLLHRRRNVRLASARNMAACKQFGTDLAIAQSLRPSSQKSYRSVIEAFCDQHGDKRVATLGREHVVKLMAAKSVQNKHHAANWLRIALRVLMQHAITIGMRSDDPTQNIKPVRIKTDGYHSWSETEIAQFEGQHRIG